LSKLEPAPVVHLAVDVAQLLVGDVGIYLGGGDIAVSQEFLDGPEVDALVQEVGGK